MFLDEFGGSRSGLARVKGDREGRDSLQNACVARLVRPLLGRTLILVTPRQHTPWKRLIHQVFRNKQTTERYRQTSSLDQYMSSAPELCRAERLIAGLKPETLFY